MVPSLPVDASVLIALAGAAAVIAGLNLAGTKQPIPRPVPVRVRRGDRR